MIDTNTLKKLKMIALVLLLPFSVLSAVALWEHGYFGIWKVQFMSYAAMQVIADLFIALVLVMIWMWHDARKTNRTFWPWAFLTLSAGSFGPLLYLLLSEDEVPQEG